MSNFGEGTALLLWHCVHSIPAGRESCLCTVLPGCSTLWNRLLIGNVVCLQCCFGRHAIIYNTFDIWHNNYYIHFLYVSQFAEYTCYCRHNVGIGNANKMFRSLGLNKFPVICR